MTRTTTVLSAALLAALALGAKTDGGARKYKLLTADQVQFKPVEGMQGIQTAQLWGDMGKNGDWGGIFKFAAGKDVGWHTHSSRIHLVMISGTLSIQPEGGEPTELSAGAYADDPGKVKHRTICKEGADCVFFIHMSKKFDFLEAKEPSAAAAPKK
jgi:hypothetical protein